MSYEMLSLAIIVLFILILFVIKLITPQIVRRELFFGVRIRASQLNDERLLDFKNTYIKILIILAVGALFLLNSLTELMLFY